jgi:pentatricopeptide repeat protein
VGKILQIGTVDDAADYIKALPIYLQSAVVWNQLIGYCAKHGRANYAEQYYVQVIFIFIILFYKVLTFFYFR